MSANQHLIHSEEMPERLRMQNQLEGTTTTQGTVTRISPCNGMTQWKTRSVASVKPLGTWSAEVGPSTVPISSSLGRRIAVKPSTVSRRTVKIKYVITPSVKFKAVIECLLLLIRQKPLSGKGALPLSPKIAHSAKVFAQIKHVQN